MKKALFFLFIIIMSAGAAVDAMAQNYSHTEYNFLRLPSSALAAALGGDNITAVDDDAALAFHNPALLTNVRDKTINLNYLNYMMGVNMLSASFNSVVKERAAWAVSAQYLDYGNMKEVTEDNVQIGEFSAKDIAIAGYFSYLLTERLSGGVTAKFITSYIGDYNSIGFGVDLGLNYYDYDKEWSVSLVMRNLGGELKAYDEEYGKMPFDMQLGVSKRFANTPFRVHATLIDLNHPKYKAINHLVLGADLLLSESFWVGGGYNFRRANEMNVTDSENKESNHGAGLTFGTGLTLNRFKVGASFGKYHVSSMGVTISLGYSL